MQSEGATPLTAAATRKHHAALERASGALRDLDAAGQVINFQAVARAAGVSRQWLYQQPELRCEIERLRESRPQSASGVPSAQRASEASLRQRNRVLLDENARLRAENAQLKNELALAYGEQRRARRRA
ncbi:MAG TPA: DUF6262 family protein [Croceibacterium sp.]